MQTLQVRQTLTCAGGYSQEREMDDFHRLLDMLKEETGFGLSTKATMPHTCPSPVGVPVRNPALFVEAQICFSL